MTDGAEKRPSVSYNEIDAFAVEWLRGLTKAGLISNGDILEGDIREIGHDEIRGKRFHAFAGVGAWDHALTLVSDGMRGDIEHCLDLGIPVHTRDDGR